jgi:small subunit ribosomal protein S13
MARLAGIDLPDNQKIDYSLTLIYGIGWKLSKDILVANNIDPTKRTKELTEHEVNSLAKALEQYTVEGDLRREIRSNIQRLRDITSYRGVRHNKGLPTKGQRTRSNARTKRGKRKTVGAFKKEVLAKQTTTAAKK